MPPKSGSAPDVLNFTVDLAGKYRLCKEAKKALNKAVKRTKK